VSLLWSLPGIGDDELIGKRSHHLESYSEERRTVPVGSVRVCCEHEAGDRHVFEEAAKDYVRHRRKYRVEHIKVQGGHWNWVPRLDVQSQSAWEIYYVWLKGTMCGSDRWCSLTEQVWSGQRF
jgi:hypothetical protein